MKVQSMAELLPVEVHTRASGLKDCFIRKNIEEVEITDEHGTYTAWQADEVQLSGDWPDGYCETHADELWEQATPTRTTIKDLENAVAELAEIVGELAGE